MIPAPAPNDPAVEFRVLAPAGEVTIESFRAAAAKAAEAAKRSIRSTAQLASAITSLADTGRFKVVKKTQP